MKIESEIRQDVVECCRRVHERGFVAANDGNLSVRLSSDRILCTPTGRSKGSLRVEELVIVDSEGKSLGDKRPSSEIGMHVAIYNVRPDIFAVVHAHPVHATAFATAGLSLEKCVAPEIITTLGSIPLAPYAAPSLPELGKIVSGVMANADACLMANHGVVAGGRDIYDAYAKMERVEHYAHIVFTARLLGGEKVLSDQQVQELGRVRENYGLGAAKNPGCLPCGKDCLGSECSLHNVSDYSAIIARIIGEL